jgi:coenzyme F420-reducing hydrogenase alpha subunit
MKSRTIKVDQLARVEGEGALHIRINDGQVGDVRLEIFEPPRFFEAFLRGRHFSEAPDITARVCGICPVAYQMSSVYAIEDAFGAAVNGPLRDLRRLLYCGEWIESHVLHVAMLHAPDFLGYEDALQLAADKPELVAKALKMKKAGNEIVRVLGGREIHPINVKVGGFYRVPAESELRPLLDDLRWGREEAIQLAGVVAGFSFPDIEIPYEFVCLSHPEEYPMLGNRIVSSSGLDIAVKEYEFHFEERHVRHSNALHSVERGKGAYAVGPLARFNLQFEKLPPDIRSIARNVGIEPPVLNPFRSILVRCVETLYAFEEAIRIIERYRQPDAPFVPVHPKAAIGFGASEAPRGLLYHRYKLGSDELIKDAKIVPPTSQNQLTIENDLRVVVGKNLEKSREELTWLCEQAVRNYDPCISCATHFLRLHVDETA